jgi:filamentous hemagglutinin family protein
VNSWVSAGAATLATSGNTLTVTQTTSNATYNWQTFNIGTGGVVRFDQPDETSIALNRIFQADPARILGQLSSNGRVYLLNRNGILFGQGAQVDVRGLVASSLDLSPEALQLGIGRAASLTAPAFQPYTEGGVALASGAVLWLRGPQSTCPGLAASDCGKTYDDATTGQVLVGAGAAALAAAIVWWAWPTGDGAPVIRSLAFCVFGKAITSRIESRPPKSITQRSIPSAMPPCGGAPLRRASRRKPNRSRATSGLMPRSENTFSCVAPSWIRIVPPPASEPLITRS